MRHFLKFTLIFLILYIFVDSCIYHRMTHLSKDELAWVTNRAEGEVAYFISQNGDIDTIKVKEIDIYNTLDPINWAYFNIGPRDYYASACVWLALHGTLGWFTIKKIQNNAPIVCSWTLYHRKAYNVPLQPSCIKVGDVVCKDVMVFDDSNMETIDSLNLDNPIVSFAFSKKYGVIQYSFQDGTVFTRVGLEQ